MRFLIIGEESQAHFCYRLKYRISSIEIFWATLTTIQNGGRETGSQWDVVILTWYQHIPDGYQSFWGAATLWRTVGYSLTSVWPVNLKWPPVMATVNGGNVWFASHPYAGVILRQSHCVAGPNKGGGSRWNLVAILYKSWDIEHSICTSGWYFICQSLRRRRVITMVPPYGWTRIMCV